MSHANSGLPQNLLQSSTCQFGIHKGTNVYAVTNLVITPSCDSTTVAVFTTRPESEIVGAPLTGGAGMKRSQHDVYDAL